MERSSDTSVTQIAAKAAGGVAGTILAAAGGWIGYSAVAVDHHVPLPPAIDAERTTFYAPTAGMLSAYVDRSCAGRPLVLIHSINAGASAYEMRPLFEHYRGTRPVYALELPGFGFSDRSDRQYTVDLYTRAILEFLDGVVHEPADVIALSLSSEFAARAALREPGLFHSLSMISPSGFNRRSVNSVQRTSERGTSERTLRAFRFPLWSQPFYDLLATERSIRYFLKQSFVGPADPGLVSYGYQTTHQPGARFAPLAFVSGRLFSRDIRESVYERLTIPVLVLYDQDNFVRFDTLPEVIARRANWQAVRVTPSRGLPQFEQLDQTSDALEQFWATADQQPATD